NPLLSGILMMIALYSINLRIMGKANVSLLNEDTFFSKVADFWESIGLSNIIPVKWSILIVMITVTLAVKILVDIFLKTEIGLAIRATGDNKRMIRSFSANTDWLIILGLGLSNALVARSEEQTSELPSRENLVFRLLLEKKSTIIYSIASIILL